MTPIDVAALTAIVMEVLRRKLSRMERPRGLMDIQWNHTVLGISIGLRNYDNTRWLISTREWALSYRFIPLGDHEAETPLGDGIVHIGCKGHLIEPKLSGNVAAFLRDFTALRVVLPAVDARHTTSQMVVFPHEDG